MTSTANASQLPQDPGRKWVGDIWFECVSRGGYGFFKHLCGGRIGGAQHIERAKAGGFILTANHVSYLDWIVLWEYFNCVHDIQLAFLAKEKLFTHPVWGPIVTRIDSVKVSNDGKRIVDAAAKRRLASSKYIALFPEGARSPTGQQRPAKPGAIRFAHKFGLPLLPVGLQGFYEAWPSHRSFPTPHPCAMHFGAAVRPVDDETVALDRLMRTIGMLSRGHEA